MPYGGTTPAEDKKIERCVANLMSKGRDKSSAIAICKSSILKKKKPGGESKVMKKITQFNEDLTFNVVEKSINEEKRTVRVCALASCISANNKYYSPSIVESQIGKLKGRPSYADHDELNTKNMVGRIISEQYEANRLYADIKFSKAQGIAEETFQKVLDGTLDSVSIAASGSGKLVKMDGKEVLEVTELDINSVDFVPEGGVKEAKVIRVFESTDNIPEIKEQEEVTDVKNVKELREKYSELVAEIEETKNAELKKANEKATKFEQELAKLKISGFKESKISELDISDAVKDILRERVTGTTEAEVTESLKKESEFLESVSKAFEKEAKIEGKGEHKEKKKEKENPLEEWSSKRVREDSRIPENLKGEAIDILWNQGADKMLEFLKVQEISMEE